MQGEDSDLSIQFKIFSLNFLILPDYFDGNIIFKMYSLFYFLPESKFEFRFHIAFRREVREALDELLEIHLPIVVVVKDIWLRPKNNLIRKDFILILTHR